MSETNLSIQTGVQDKFETKDWTSMKMIYTGLIAISLISHLWMIAFGIGINNIPTFIWLIRLSTVPFVFFWSRPWKEKGFMILFLYFLYFVFRCVVPNPESIFSTEIAESVLSALWLFIGCYGLGMVLNTRQLKLFLGVCSFIWTIGMIVYSGVGIYTAWTDSWFPGLQNGNIDIWDNRLEIIYVATTTGGILAISSVVGIIAIFGTKVKACRWFYILAEVPILTAIALTDSRTAYIITATGWSIAFTILIIERLFSNNNKKVLLFVLCALILFVVNILVISHITTVFNSIKTKGYITSAYAETETKRVIEQRGFAGFSVSTGRDKLWNEITQYFIQNPQSLIFGKSKQNPLIGINDSKGHSHNLLLQVLIEGGIIGLVILLAFLAYESKCSYRLLFKKQKPVWIKLLVIIPVSLLVGDLFECFIWLRSSQCIMAPVFFIASGFITQLSKDIY